MNLRSLLLPLFFSVLAPTACAAQDVIMAKDNAQVTLSIGPVNFQGIAMRNTMEDLQKFDFYWMKRFDYEVRFSKPLSLTGEYAISAYTTIGLNINYFSYKLSEHREDDHGVTGASTRGSHTDLHLRGLRWVCATPRSAFYVLGEAGISVRSISYTTEKGSTGSQAYINTFPETRPSGIRTFSYDYGIGMKVKLLGSAGVSAEFTRSSLFGRYGLFYIIEPAGRRAKDPIGW